MAATGNRRPGPTFDTLAGGQAVTGPGPLDGCNPGPGFEWAPGTGGDKRTRIRFLPMIRLKVDEGPGKKIEPRGSSGVLCHGSSRAWRPLSETQA